MLGICDSKVSEEWKVNFDLIIHIYFITIPKVVIYKFIPVDFSIDFIEFNWVLPVLWDVVISDMIC
jgi:hypothetical protein